jgi:hypothetical protein
MANTSESNSCRVPALRTRFPARPGVGGQPPEPERTSGDPGVMAGPSETKPPLFAAMFDRSSLNRARLCDHENLGRHLRFGADRHRGGICSDPVLMSGTAPHADPDPVTLAVAHAVKSRPESRPWGLGNRRKSADRA